MIARAQEHARSEGVVNASVEQADAQVYAFADGAFDCIVSRFGLFFASPGPAFSNLWRATRASGRLAVA